MIYLAGQNKELKQPTKPDSIADGDYFILRGLEQIQAKALDSTSSKQIVFVFTSKCSRCKENINNWNRIASSKEAESFTIIGLSLDSLHSTTAYSIENKILFPVYYVTDMMGYAKANKLYGVPKTVIRNQMGLVERVWEGVLTSEVVSEILHYLNNNQT